MFEMYYIAGYWTFTEVDRVANLEVPIEKNEETTILLEVMKLKILQYFGSW